MKCLKDWQFCTVTLEHRTQNAITITHRTHDVVAHGRSAVDAAGHDVAEKDLLVVVGGVHHLDDILRE